jgi:cullin 1
VPLNQAVKAEQKAETVEVLQAVDEDRKFVYQATIVRLMKARKVGLVLDDGMEWQALTIFRP